MSSTGLSVNEIYCLEQKGYRPGNLVIGNCVYPLGSVNGLGAALKIPFGSELPQITQFIRQGRLTACQHMQTKATGANAAGIAGIRIELIYHAGCIEFVAKGSIIQAIVSKDQIPFTTPADGQELYALMDAGYKPITLAFANVAYSIGLAQGLFGNLKTLARGEIKEFSDALNSTRRLALERICEDARQHKANAVLGIRTIISPFGRACDMRMTGTACFHPQLPVQTDNEIVTSHLTNIELWNLTRMAYVPLRLLMATSVYSLGLAGNLNSALKSFSHAEIREISVMMNNARENSLAIINAEAKKIGADDVVSVETYTYQLGNGLVEFLTLATAVKKLPGLKTDSEQLPLQTAFINEGTFYNRVGAHFNACADVGHKYVFTGNTPLGAIIRIALVVVVIGVLIWLGLK